MHILTILLQAADTLPTNIWTVGGALGIFAGVIVYLFKLYDSSQEKRMQELKATLEGQISRLDKDLNDEKLARRSLQEQVNNNMLGAINKNNTLLESVERLLDTQAK